MSDPYIAEIMMFGGNFAIRGWALCDGQLLAISQNTALFSILGTTFGGDGRSTFGLPDMRGRSPVHVGTGPGLSNRRWGARGGAETTTQNVTELAAHSHTGTVSVALPTNSGAANNNPAGADFATAGSANVFASGGGAGRPMAAHDYPLSTLNTGGNISMNNMQPFLAVYFEIALVGIFPSRS